MDDLADDWHWVVLHAAEELEPRLYLTARVDTVCGILIADRPRRVRLFDMGAPDQPTCPVCSKEGLPPGLLADVREASSAPTASRWRCSARRRLRGGYTAGDGPRSIRPPESARHPRLAWHHLPLVLRAARQFREHRAAHRRAGLGSLRLRQLAALRAGRAAPDAHHRRLGRPYPDLPPRGRRRLQGDPAADARRPEAADRTRARCAGRVPDSPDRGAGLRGRRRPRHARHAGEGRRRRDRES